ncbi:RDD family protein [Heyndrickxia sp. NPDC080065]|uniref:RDD family protein n=1 Tax=Heyndrickxia sp. NPDC080065 TaxID=3390568 RepID=UPI003CFC5B51
MNEASIVTKQREYAGFWLRFVAYLIDIIIVGVPFTILSFIAILLFLGSTGSFENLDIYTAEAELSGQQFFLLLAFYLILGLAGIFVSIAYFAGFHASKMQATLGKRILGLKVVDLEGNRISFLRGLGRYFAMILSGILYIGYIVAAFTEKKQALHDMIAGTYVIKSK